MEGTPKHDREYYRCVARTLAPGSPALADHPRTVQLPKRAVMPALNAWVAALFDPDARDATVAALLASQDGAPADETRVRSDAEQRLTEAETRIRRFQEAIASGVYPEAVTDAISQAQAQRKTARAMIPAAPVQLTAADVHAMVDSLEDRIGAELTTVNSEPKRKLYNELRLEMT